MNSTSDFKPLTVAVLTVLILIGIFVPDGKLIATLALLPLAVMDRNKALFALLALFLLRVTNTAISGPEPLLATAAWFTSLAASTRLWLGFVMRVRYIGTRHLGTLTLYALVALMLSSTSLSPAVSFLKALAFFYIAGAILVAITSQPPAKATICDWLNSAWASVLITSVPTLAFPDVGYFRDGQGFQGSLNHPQALGIFLAPMVAWLLGKSFGAQRVSLIRTTMLILAISLLFLTRARTGIASILLGVVVLYLFRARAAGSSIKWLARRKAFQGVLLLILLISPVLYGDFRDGVKEYVFKSATFQALDTAFEESRGFIFLQAVKNFENHPITGIGFGVSYSETHGFNIDTDPMTGLPVGAPTEKANLIIAVLEETGVVGMIAFAAFFLPFLRVIANSNDIAMAWAALTAVCTNISEVTFFSMGGFGTYTWIICALAVALAPLRYRRSRNREFGANASNDTKVIHEQL